MSQTDLGSLIGRSLGWVNKLEKDVGTSALNDELIEKIASALGVPVEFLYDENEHELPEMINMSINTVRVDADPASWSITLNDLNLLTPAQIDNLSFALDLYKQAQERVNNAKKE